MFSDISVLLVITVVISFIIKGMCGFANTLVFTTILSFERNNISISPVELLLTYPSNFLILWQERKSIRLKKCIPIALLVICCSIMGAFVLKTGDAQVIKTIFGFVVVFMAAEMFFRERNTSKKKSSTPMLILISVVAGVMCGMFGIGALLAAYMGRTTNNMGEFKANLNVIFAFEGAVRIITYIVAGIMTLKTVQTALILMPLMILGMFIGFLISKKINEKLAKQIVIIMLALSGLSLVITNFINMLG